MRNIKSICFILYPFISILLLTRKKLWRLRSEITAIICFFATLRHLTKLFQDVQRLGRFVNCKTHKQNKRIYVMITLHWFNNNISFYDFYFFPSNFYFLLSICFASKISQLINSAFKVACVAIDEGNTNDKNFEWNSIRKSGFKKVVST